MQNLCNPRGRREISRAFLLTTNPYLYLMQKLDYSDIFILSFVAIIFTIGCITVFRFMRNKK